MFEEIFNDLLSEYGLNRKQFAEKSGIPYSTVMGWTRLKRLPDYVALIKIADFFDCSVDYLTGRQDEFGSRSSDMQSESFPDKGRVQKLLKNFRKLSPDCQDLLLTLSEKLAASETK